MRREDRIQFVLAIIISFTLSISSMPINYSNLLEGDVFSPNQYFENSDEENLLVGEKENSEGLQIPSPLVTQPSGKDILDETYYSFYQIPSFNQKSTVLRC